MPSIHDSLMAKAAEWREEGLRQSHDDKLGQPEAIIWCACELEALAKQVCAEARQEANKEAFQVVDLKTVECDIIGGGE